ncbi:MULTISPECIES: four helix bundle protein [Thermodesulfovibrio]|uniref:Four helix bundle protein n=1 Tax=Thermodesulfovibrio obliviosus TaxID=3118332 RepID=A0AAU8H1G1_9BACT
MMVRYFEELDIWKEARLFTKKIYEITKNSSFSKDYGLVDQIRRASVSVMSNIAEGFERGSNQEFLQFLYIAKGSCGEVRTQLYVALDQGYIDKKDFDELLSSAKKLSIMISNLISHIKGSRFKGEKFKPVKHKSMKEEIEEIAKNLGIDIARKAQDDSK